MNGKATLDIIPDLTALKVANGVRGAAELPKRIKVLNWGDNQSTKGNFKVGSRTMEVLPLNQRQLGFERVALDYAHCTIPGTPEYKKGEVPSILGYGRLNVVQNDGIYLEDLDYTPLGVEKAKLLEDLSPAPHKDDATGEVDFIHSVALCPNGSLYDVQFLSATINQEKKSMKPEEVILLSEIAPAFGLVADAKKDDVLAKIKTLAALSAIDFSAIETRLKKMEEAATKNVATLSATIDGKQVTFTAEDVVKLSARFDALEKTLKDRTDAELESAKLKVIALFAQDGKAPIDPATQKPFAVDALKKMDLPALQLLHANTPVTVPLSARNLTPGGESKPTFKDAKGNVNLAAVFEHENKTAG